MIYTLIASLFISSIAFAQTTTDVKKLDEEILDQGRKWMEYFKSVQEQPSVKASILYDTERYMQAMESVLTQNMEDKKDTCTLSGNLEITKNTLIQCDVLTIENAFSARVRNGATLFLNAHKILVNGYVKIDAHGENGAEGIDGQNAPESVWDTLNFVDFNISIKDCKKENKNEISANDQALNGTDGGKGEDGGIIILSVQPTYGPPIKDIENKIDYNTKYGVGGRGGRGGRGADHIYRGANRFMLNECQKDGECIVHCPDGKQGKKGSRGRNGLFVALVVHNLLDKNYPWLPLEPFQAPKPVTQNQPPAINP
jgi:hypothetical protein